MVRGSAGEGDLPGLDELYVEQVQVPVDKSSTGRRRGWIEGRFLRGPIPLNWLGRACRLSGEALATALAIWYVSGLQKGERAGLTLTTKKVELLGVSRSAKSRGLKALEAAGLIRVQRDGKKNPVVTILDV